MSSTPNTEVVNRLRPYSAGKTNSIPAATGHREPADTASNMATLQFYDTRFTLARDGLR